MSKEIVKSESLDVYVPDWKEYKPVKDENAPTNSNKSGKFFLFIKSNSQSS